MDDVSTSLCRSGYISMHCHRQMRRKQEDYIIVVIVGPGSRPYVNEQRGDPTDNDAFFSTILRFGWRLNGNDPNSMARRQMRCPVFYYD